MEKTYVYKDFIESIPWWMLDQVFCMTPWINVIWWWMKNAIEGSKNIRILRWIEFFEWIANPEFIKELEESEQALDWLAICFESYTKERSEEKRRIIKNVFLWFSELSGEEKEEFELEKFLNTTKYINELGTVILSIYNKEKIDSTIKSLHNSFQKNPSNKIIQDNIIMLNRLLKWEYMRYLEIKKVSNLIYNNKYSNLSFETMSEAIKSMLNLNLLIGRQWWGGEEWENWETVKITSYWKKFIKYITK